MWTCVLQCVQRIVEGTWFAVGLGIEDPAFRMMDGVRTVIAHSALWCFGRTGRGTSRSTLTTFGHGRLEAATEQTTSLLRATSATSSREAKSSARSLRRSSTLLQSWKSGAQSLSGRQTANPSRSLNVNAVINHSSPTIHGRDSVRIDVGIPSGMNRTPDIPSKSSDSRAGLRL